MGDYTNTFDWVQFPEGRGRFAGLKRGCDDQGHTTFSVELRGNEYFGEIDQVFLPDQHNFNVEIIWFGYGRGEDVGIPGAAAKLTSQEIGTAKELITQLVHAGRSFSRPPNVLQQTPVSQFMGEVIFREGWALLKNNELVS